VFTITRIIFVHGIGLDTGEDYWKPWSAALAESLKCIELNVAESSFDGVYYADIYAAVNLIDISHKLQKERFILQVKNNAREDMYRQTPFHQRGQIEDVLDNGSKLFGQMYHYFHDDQVYECINKRLYDKLASVEDKVHLIGYSLGSLISFCSLQQRRELTGKVKNFIMVGCPLFWLRHGMKLRADLHVKPTLNHFTNVAGILDIAYPQIVPRYVEGLDEQVKVTVNRYNPVKGHSAYFDVKTSLNAIAEIIKKYYHE
jgi:hypothetical protein